MNIYYLKQTDFILPGLRLLSLRFYNTRTSKLHYIKEDSRKEHIYVIHYPYVYIGYGANMDEALKQF